MVVPRCADLTAAATRTSPFGARYRIRLLYKSHIRTMSGAETRYGCLWCVQTGSTVRGCDATVFPSADDLLRHLATHPQPLPDVVGTSVSYGPLPTTQIHDYDLHLPDAAAPVAVPEGLGKLARAVAIKDHLDTRRAGSGGVDGGRLERPSKNYTGAMLEFLTGATVTGIRFPVAWEGKWCVGRHDGRIGAFPAKAVQLLPPPRDDVPISSGGSRMCIMARWKWSPPPMPPSPTGETVVPWLGFAKGETLYRVECAPHHCSRPRRTQGSQADPGQVSTPTFGATWPRTGRARRAYSPARTSTFRPFASWSRAKRQAERGVRSAEAA